MRLRTKKNFCQVITVSIKNNNFIVYSKQKKLDMATNCTNTIIKCTYELFDKLWRGEPIRLIGVTLGNLCNVKMQQLSLFDDKTIESKLEKSKALDNAIDNIKKKYGDNSIVRFSFFNKD